MQEFRWNLLKSERLKKTRGMSFDEITKAKLIKIKEHPNKAEQRLLLFETRGYIWVVPCVIKEGGIFLKTLYPSRKYTKMFKRGELS